MFAIELTLSGSNPLVHWQFGMFVSGGGTDKETSAIASRVETSKTVVLFQWFIGPSMPKSL